MKPLRKIIYIYICYLRICHLTLTLIALDLHKIVLNNYIYKHGFTADMHNLVNAIIWAPII